MVHASAVGRFLIREVWISGSYRSSAEGSVRAIATVGGALRIMGARRTVLQLAESPWNLDAGLRLGPSILFRFEESRIDRNKRFTLLADPFVRAGYGRFSLELAVHSPSVRAGFWIPI